MKEFKIILHESFKASRQPFQVHVAAYKNTFNGIVNVPSGMPCTFIAFFHDDVDAGTREGIKRIPANSLFIFKPGKLLFSGRDESPWQRSWLRCSGTLVSHILKENAIPYNTPITFDNSEMTEKYLSDIYQEWEHPLGADSENLNYIFRLWMRNVKRHYYGNTSFIPENFIRARQYIEANCLKNPTLGEIASKCGVTRQHLCKGFRKYFGLSPVDYAIKLRLQYAVEMLDDINLNISEIAEICGYADLFYFSKLFKKHFGHSPLVFRKKRITNQ